MSEDAREESRGLDDSFALSARDVDAYRRDGHVIGRDLARPKPRADRVDYAGPTIW